MDKSLEWVKRLKTEEVEESLDKDARLVYENCGIDVFLSLWDSLPSISIHVSGKPLDRLRRLYIKKYFNGNNQKDIMLLLDCSERFFYDTLEQDQKSRVHVNQGALFSTS